MQEPGPNQGRQPIVRVDVALEVAQEPVEQVWRWGNEDGVPRTRAADPVLGAPDLPWMFVGTSRTFHQTRVRLIEQSHREWQPFSTAKLFSRVRECVYVVAHFLDVRSWRRIVFALRLECQQVDQRGLRSLDLRRDHGFLPDEPIDEPVDRGDHLAGELETTELPLGTTEKREGLGVEAQRRVRRRQGLRHEGPDLLAANRRTLVSPGNSCHLPLKKDSLPTPTQSKDFFLRGERDRAG